MDDTAGGDDSARSELIVEGTLDASAGPITFGSARAPPAALDWYGIRVESGGSATLTNVTVRDGMQCVQAAGGSLNQTNTTLLHCGTAPTISGSPTPSVEEGTTDDVATYTATDAEDDAVSWSLVDAHDASAFAITSAGVLRFEPAPDFEAPTDADGDNVYHVTVRAEDRQAAATDHSVTVQVVNVEEAGTVTVEPTTARADGSLSPPREGEELTATLTDPDGGGTGTGWQWQRRASDTTEWVDITDATAAAYLPVAEDVGHELQATVRYSDGHNSGKSAVSEATEAVVGRPSAPRAGLSIRARGPVLHVSWGSVAAEPAVDEYAVQVQRKPYGGAWPNSWTAITSRIEATTTRYTYGSFDAAPLDSGSHYRFQVRAHNAHGWSAWSAMIPNATGVQPKPGAPQDFTAEAGDGQVTLRWTPLSDETITEYRYHRRLEINPNFGVSLKASSSTSHTVGAREGLNKTQTYIFQVWAVNPAGAGQPSVASDPVTPRVPCALAVSGSSAVAYAENGTDAVGTYTATAADCGTLTWALTGTDASAFRLDGTGTTRTLHFKTTPNFEVQSAYAVDVVVSDGTVSATQAVAAVAGDRQVALSWQAPLSDGGSAITGYVSVARVGPVADVPFSQCARLEVKRSYQVKEITL